MTSSESHQSSHPRAWEPFVAIAIAISALALAGCSQDIKSTSAQIVETKPECAATAVPNSYVVHWKDGTVSVARGWTRKEFESEIFEPHKAEISTVEQDQKVQIAPLGSSFSPENVRPFDSVNTMGDAADLWGQTIIAAPDVWNLGVKGKGVTVAVVDSGVDIRHPLLRNHIATNAKEIPDNGIDDDGNGYIDDVHGWDFDNDQAVVTDTAGHGTHVAGIVVAEHGVSGIKGVAPEAKLLPLDFMNADGHGNVGDAILAIQYAADQGARVINASWGGTPCSQTLRKTIIDLEKRGVMFVAAAGNSGVDIERMPEYPAAFTSLNQITVGASTLRDFTADFSNFSFHLVQLFAPGSSIASTYPDGRIASLSGTSMAAPFVTGAAALLFSAFPKATVAQVRDAILSTVDRGGFAATSQGRLNVKKALSAMK